MNRRILHDDFDRHKIKSRMQDRPTELKFKNPLVKKCIIASVENCEEWQPAVAAEAFSLLEKISWNLLCSPKRKLYHEVKTYSGTFKHILSRLAMVDELLQEIGYKRESNCFVLHRRAEDLEDLVDDFLHASILCEIMEDFYGTESDENRRLMCKIRLDPAYLEQQEARPPVVENGVRERPSPIGRVKFLDGDSYTTTSPKSRPQKTPNEAALTVVDKQLTRPRPRSILRQPGNSGASLSTQIDDADFRERNTVALPPERHEVVHHSRTNVENKASGIRVNSIPPANYSDGSYNYGISRLGAAVDYRNDENHSSSRTLSSNYAPGRYHHHSPPEPQEARVRMRSDKAVVNHSTSNRRRSGLENATARRDRPGNRSSVTESHRHSGIGGYRR